MARTAEFIEAQTFASGPAPAKRAEANWQVALAKVKLDEQFNWWHAAHELLRVPRYRSEAAQETTATAARLRN